MNLKRDLNAAQFNYKLARKIQNYYNSNQRCLAHQNRNRLANRHQILKSRPHQPPRETPNFRTSLRSLTSSSIWRCKPKHSLGTIVAWTCTIQTRTPSFPASPKTSHTPTCPSRPTTPSLNRTSVPRKSPSTSLIPQASVKVLMWNRVAPRTVQMSLMGPSQLDQPPKCHRCKLCNNNLCIDTHWASSKMDMESSNLPTQLNNPPNLTITLSNLSSKVRRISIISSNHPSIWVPVRASMSLRQVPGLWLISVMSRTLRPSPTRQHPRQSESLTHLSMDPRLRQVKSIIT